MPRSICPVACSRTALIQELLGRARQWGCLHWWVPVAPRCSRTLSWLHPAPAVEGGGELQVITHLWATPRAATLWVKSGACVVTLEWMKIFGPSASEQTDCWTEEQHFQQCRVDFLKNKNKHRLLWRSAYFFKEYCFKYNLSCHTTVAV